MDTTKQIAQILLWKQHDGYEFLAEIDVDDFPIEVIEAIAEVLKNNKHKHGVGKWKTDPIQDHLNHAKQHILDWLYDIDTGEPHLEHALTRLAFAVWQEKKGK